MGNHCTMEARMRDHASRKQLLHVRLVWDMLGHRTPIGWVGLPNSTKLIWSTSSQKSTTRWHYWRGRDLNMWQCGVETCVSTCSDSIMESSPSDHFGMMILSTKWNLLTLAWHASVSLHNVCKKSWMQLIVTDYSCGWKVFERARITSLCTVWSWGEWDIC